MLQSKVQSTPLNQLFYKTKQMALKKKSILGCIKAYYK